MAKEGRYRFTIYKTNDSTEETFENSLSRINYVATNKSNKWRVKLVDVTDDESGEHIGTWMNGLGSLNPGWEHVIPGYR